MKPLLNRFLRISSVFALAFGLSVLARHQTHHFTVDRIISTVPYHEEWEFVNPPIVEKILEQPFHFYDNGRQSWVFLSEDGEWILKFLDFPLVWSDLTKNLNLPDLIKPRLTEKQKQRREHPLEGYALAFSRFKQSCGLIGAFLNGKYDGITQIQIYDAINCGHLIDLKNTSFVLQKRAKPLIEKLNELLKTGKTDQASKILSQSLNLVAARCFAGIRDTDDANLHLNLGFVEDEPIYLDAGKFKDVPELCLPKNAEQEVLRTADLLIGIIAQN